MEKDDFRGPENPKETSSWDSLKDVEFQYQPLSEAVDMKDISSLNLTKNSELGEGRHDYAVTATDAAGNSMRSSNIMLGKDNTFELGGEFLSAEDLQTAVERALADGGDGARLERIEPAKPYDDRTEAVRDILIAATEGKDSIELSQSEKIVTQDARETVLHSAETGENRKSSLLFFGNERVEMPNGEYISAESAAAALANFMLVTPVIPPVEPPVPPRTPNVPRGGEFPPEGDFTPTEITHEPEIIKEEIHDEVVERTKDPKNRKWLAKFIPVILAATIVLAPGLKAGESGAIDNPEPIPPVPIVETIEQNFAGGINIGDVYNISVDDSGELVTVYESSDHEYGGKDAEGKIGGNTLKEGDYTVESFSVLDPETHATKNVTWEDGTNLDEYMEEVSERTGATKEDLEAKIHLSKDGSPAGWVELNDLENNINNNQGQ